MRTTLSRPFQYAHDCGQEKATAKYPFIFDLHTEYQDRSLIRDQLFNVLLAGRDTTACTMSWTIFHLVRHSEMLQQLREEINEVTGSETVITRSHTRKMSYLNAVLNESKDQLSRYSKLFVGNKAYQCYSPQTLPTGTYEHQIHS